MPTEVLELSRDVFAALLARHPSMLTNLNRILAQRLAQRHLPQGDGRRGETVALITGSEHGPLAAAIVAAAKLPAHARSWRSIWRRHGGA